MKQSEEETITIQFENRVADCKLELEQARAALNDEQQAMSRLEDELIKMLRGATEYTPEMINKMYDMISESIATKSAAVKSLEHELTNSQEIMLQAKRQHSEIMTWADMYSQSPMDIKKMIVSQLISAVRVSRDYNLEIDFKISEQQLGLDKELNVGEPK